MDGMDSKIKYLIMNSLYNIVLCPLSYTLNVLSILLFVQT